MRFSDLYIQRQIRRALGSPRTRIKILSTAAMGLFVALLASILIIGLVFTWYAKDLPRPDRVRRNEGLSTVVLDRNGEKLYDIFEDENRLPVKWEDIPEYLKNATTAIEDKDFYSHQGLSTSGIIRGMFACLLKRRCQGGSTLTQQLVKNVLLTSERTLPRKMKEVILAIQIERKYTKDEILQMYLNEAPYGGTAVGVEAASEYYFGKPVRQLGLVESVILAGLPQAPSRYSPFGENERAYIDRSYDVLRRMREDKHITPLQELEARKALESVVFVQGDSGLKAPHFISYVRELLTEKLGKDTVDAGGLTVTTTLDWRLQEKAQGIVAEEIEKAKRLKVSNGAAVALDPSTGEILAMVGSKDYAASDSGGYKFNVVTQGLRQPGSAIKPITYAAALKKGYTASMVLTDVDTKYPSGVEGKPEYNPKNYDGKFRGPMMLRDALGNSINTIAVKLTAIVGIRDVLRTAYDMGLSTLEPTDENLKRFGLSITLGGGEVKLLELTSAFGVLANGGVRNDTVAILKIVDTKGEVLFEHRPITGKRVIGEDVSYIISDILSDNEARKEVFSPRSLLVIPGHTVAVKTGTTDDKRDNWTVGYTRSIVVGTWVGNNDNSPMHPSLASGVTGAAPIWNRIIKEYLKGKSDEPFVRPANVMESEIDSFGGGIPVQGLPTKKEKFISGTEPNELSTIYRKLRVSRRDNGKLANPVEIAKGDFDEKVFIVISEKDPISTDGKNRWQEAIDAWIAGQGDARYHPPTETYQDDTEQITLTIREPSDLAQLGDNAVKVVVEAASLNDIQKIEIFIGPTLVRDTASKKFSDTITVADGSHILKARAIDNKGNATDREIRIGVKTPYATPTQIPTSTPLPTPTPVPTL